MSTWSQALYIQMALMLLAGIVASHGAIAGEKDRRSWDLLQVAPVTQYQIVVGKFLGSASLLLAIQAAFLPILLLFSVSQPNIATNLVHLGIVEVLSLGVGLFASGGTILLSSKLKSANSTLVAAIALASLYAVSHCCSSYSSKAKTLKSPFLIFILSTGSGNCFMKIFTTTSMCSLYFPACCF